MSETTTAPDRVSVDRETFAQLVACAQAVLPILVAQQSPRAWALSEAITVAEAAVLNAGRQ